MRLPARVRWWELGPEVVVGLGLALFLVTEPEAATSALSSSKAIALVVAVGGGWLVARFVLGRFTPWPALRLVVFGAAGAGVLATVVLPAYDDETVVEALPLEVPAPTAAGPTSTTAPPAPVLVASGELHGIDHRATGTAAIYRQPSGRFVVGLEEIEIQPGPDYDVYLVPGADRDDVDGGVRLDDLRGNRGTQYYDVPEGTEPQAGGWTVLVWCQTFAVPVAGATPAA